MQNRLWQFDIFRPSSSARWWARNDSLCMKNSEKADRPISAMLQVTSPCRLSGKAAQAERTPAKRVSSISMQTRITPQAEAKPTPRISQLELLQIYEIRRHPELR